MVEDKKIWLKIDGEHVVDHNIDIKKFAKILETFQQIAYKLRPGEQAPELYQFYLNDIKPGSADVCVTVSKTFAGDLNKSYNELNKFYSGINDSEDIESLKDHVDNSIIEGEPNKLVSNLKDLWPKDNEIMGIALSKEQPKDISEYILFKPEAKKNINELYNEYHKPVRKKMHGILSRIATDIDQFGFLTSKKDLIKGKFNLNPELKDALLENMEKPVEINGEYDKANKKFVKLYSVYPSNQIFMDSIGEISLQGRTEKIYDKINSYFDSIIFKTEQTTLEKVFEDKTVVFDKLMHDLKSSLEFQHSSEERKEALSDYFEVLELILNNYKPTMNELLKSAKDIFNDEIVSILAPIPERMIKSGKTKYIGSLTTYDELLKMYVSRLESKLESLEDELLALSKKINRADCPEFDVKRTETISGEFMGYKLKKEMLLNVLYIKNEEIWEISFNDLNLFGIGDTYELAKEHFELSFETLIDGYLKYPNEKLSKDGLELKNRLITYLGE
ncbi:hypothetical protein [Methanococcus maripaludis]|uniref:Chaperonin cofactor prefoldin n=2 Tax=Methanococcus maripaludis TaxID=39152 RepID=A0A7J9PEV2_METMI|nr:hypothetical protein [Methanococcus maripaludis]MBA2861793.1 chaperonin cofactor prefoldin [Methanococcus maripaludis]